MSFAGWTPLRSSAWAGHVGVVDILLQSKAAVILTLRIFVQYFGLRFCNILN